MEMPQSPAAASAEWWRQAVVYQIYPRSFADSDGDGLGDLKGILSRVPYLASLDIDAVWLSPFYPSGLADGGYDVDDYRDVDPQLGTLADFDEMTASLHGWGIKVIVDIVPNHTSNRHAWFREALAAPKGSRARDRYIFRDGQGPDSAQPPSDWASVFGGPAWTRVPDGQWYLHLFAAEQPDLNWANREVRDDFLTTLRFWSDRGVDGFRVDVAHGLAKNLAEPLEPLGVNGDLADSPLSHGNHPLWDRDEVHDIYAEWRRVFNEYDPPRAGVAEAWVHPSRRPRYASPDGLGQAFNFDLLEANWKADEFLRVITDNLADVQRYGASTTWVLSNHDVVRHATRYALPAEDYLSSTRNAKAWLLSNGTSPELDRGLGLRRARAATLLMLALPGSVYLYQGEELGLHEVADIPAEQIADPAFLRSGGAEKGRDGCRVPLPWTADGPSFGFGTGPAHLPQPAWFGPLSVQAQEHDPASTLALYRQALSWRRKLQAAESLEGIPGINGQVLHFGRPGGWRSVTNFGSRPVPVPRGTVVVASNPLQDGLLPADTTAWIITAGHRFPGTRKGAVTARTGILLLPNGPWFPPLGPARAAPVLAALPRPSRRPAWPRAPRPGPALRGPADRCRGGRDRGARGCDLADDVVPGRHLVAVRGDPGRVVHPLQVTDLPVLGQRHHQARGPGPGRAPRAVQVVLGVVRRVVLDDEVDVVDVDAAGGDVGGDQDPRIAGGEPVQGPLALVLVAVPVDRGGADPGPAQLLGQPVGAVLGPHEEQRASFAAGDFRRDRHLVLRAEHQHAVLGQAGVNRRGDRVQRGIADVGGHQLAHPAVQGGGEEHPLTAGRRGVEDPGDRGQEAEVGHVVSLVDHGYLDPAEPASSAFHEVDEPARGGHHQVGVADPVDLPPD
jgi:alpha-glucosidase